MNEQAVEKRICQLCQERQISINDLANIPGIALSTVYSLLNGKSKNPGIVTIKKYVMGWIYLLWIFLIVTYSAN